ncbi:MAG TPA: hypothetical protein VHN80_13875 [Kineosporiaceae bacterium]|jgi:hypothetical protein|nr:hypothetical protein [Kineosporiaceae bacterium]
MRARWWKVIGLAGLAGVAATGVVVARAERRRQAYTPDEVRTRLQERFAEAAANPPEGPTARAAADPG